MELGLTIPLQRHLRIKALPYGQEPDRRFWLKQTVNAKPGRCVGFEGLGSASERLADTLRKLKGETCGINDTDRSDLLLK